jgi:uncharacterized membrane protein YedE/YeeE
MPFISVLNHSPWPWYIAGPLIGLMVPILLLLGNRSFGISATLRHMCAALIPGNIHFFNYQWKKEIWNLIFVTGIIIGAIFSATILNNPNPTQIHPHLATELAGYGITDYDHFIPVDLMNWKSLFKPASLILLVLGGFLVGFGTRYAGGCTSGHSIMGLATLQLPSLIATCCFLIGGFIAANLLLPLILSMS